jgi:hypothetical protein
MLEAQNQDQIEEFKHLTKLLKEKNVYIQEMREKLKNPYNMIENAPAQTSQPPSIPQTLNSTTESNINSIFTNPGSSDTTDKNPSIIERIKGIISP